MFIKKAVLLTPPVFENYYIQIAVSLFR